MVIARKNFFHQKIMKFNCFSEAGSISKANQDSVHASEDKVILCDGHGILGKEVSAMVIQKLLVEPTFQSVQTEVAKYLNSKGALLPSGHIRWMPIVTGGTTCTMAVIRDGQVTCTHLGDSPCYIFRQDGTHELLTVGNHDPTNLNELTDEHRKLGIRFIYANTDVDTCCLPPKNILRKPDGSPSSYLIGSHHPYGLAMTRAFGDLHIGYMNRSPTVHSAPFGEGDILVVGSDGIFDIILKEDGVDKKHILPHVRPHLIELSEFGSMLRTMEPSAVFEKCVSHARLVYGSQADDMSLCIVTY